MNRQEALDALTAECTLRLMPLRHAQRRCRHYRQPGPGEPVRCYGSGVEVPAATTITQAQGWYEALSAPPGPRVADHTTEGSGV